MSFQLVVVALLAATAAAASRGNRVETSSSCTDKDTCKTCTDKKTYPVGSCQKEGDKDVYWRAEECTASTETFNIKGYTTMENCKSQTAETKKTFSTECKAMHTKLVCTGDAVTLYVCDSDMCSDTSCSKVEFKKEGTNADTCKSVFGKNLKPPVGAFTPTCGDGPVQFEEYTAADCSGSAEGTTTDVTMACTASTKAYYTATCSTNDGFKKKTMCTNEGCTAGCTEETTLPLGKYTKVGSSYWYLKECPSGSMISVDTYDNFKTFKKACTQEATGDKYASATCVTSRTETATLPTTAAPAAAPKTATKTLPPTTKKAASETNATTKASTAAPGTESPAGPAPAAGGSTTESNNTNDTIGDGATARSMAPVGVFALVMLAYAL